MCKTPIDWSKTQIYRICADDPTIEQQYVGSTTNLIKRRQTHKNATNNPNNRSYNELKYVFIHEHGGWDAWSVALIEAYAASSSEDARRRERHYIEFHTAELNTMKRPAVSAEETRTCKVNYYALHAEEICKRHAIYKVLMLNKAELRQKQN